MSSAVVLATPHRPMHSSIAATSRSSSASDGAGGATAVAAEGIGETIRRKLSHRQRPNRATSVTPAYSHAVSQAGSERDRRTARPADELTQVVAELRAELQSIRERELRRESRLVTFDQQVAQMEASLEKEVERLRTTGSAVDLITEHLRIAVRELLGEREHMAGELDDLRAPHRRRSAPPTSNRCSPSSTR